MGKSSTATTSHDKEFFDGLLWSNSAFEPCNHPLTQDNNDNIKSFRPSIRGSRKDTINHSYFDSSKNLSKTNQPNKDSHRNTHSGRIMRKSSTISTDTQSSNKSKKKVNLRSRSHIS